MLPAGDQDEVELKSGRTVGVKGGILWVFVSQEHCFKVLGSCDRASWAKYEERKTNKMQQLDVYY